MGQELEIKNLFGESFFFLCLNWLTPLLSVLIGNPC